MPSLLDGGGAPPAYDATMDSVERTGRRRRGWIIVVVAILLVGVPGGLTWWWGEQAEDRAKELVKRVEVGAKEIDAVEFDELHLRGVTGGASFAEALGLQDEWEGTAFGTGKVSLSFRVRAGWETRCVHALLQPGQAVTEIAASRGCQVRSI